jgi:hypothetical protein
MQNKGELRKINASVWVKTFIITIVCEVGRKKIKILNNLKLALIDF